jgi:sec-independent protein translocase protein TatA
VDEPTQLRGSLGLLDVCDGVSLLWRDPGELLVDPFGSERTALNLPGLDPGCRIWPFAGPGIMLYSGGVTELVFLKSMNTSMLATLGGWEIAGIVVVVLVLFGARKVPELMGGLGKGIREFKKASREVQDEIQQAIEEDPAPRPTPRPPAQPSQPRTPPSDTPTDSGN